MTNSSMDDSDASRQIKHSVPTDKYSQNETFLPKYDANAHQNGFTSFEASPLMDYKTVDVRLTPMKTKNQHTKWDPGTEDLDTCGWKGVCSPKWLQGLANKKSFVFVFCLTCAIQGMYYTYFASLVTTMEKLLQIKSRMTGIIMSATEIGQIIGGMFFAYYGGRGHRPKWIAWGMVLFSFSSFLCAVPYFIFGQNLLNAFLETAPSEKDPIGTANYCVKNESFSLVNNISTSLYDKNFTNTFETIYSEPTFYSTIVLSIFFVALLGIGIGQTAVYNLGIPYIDDNVANRDSPLYFGITMGVRIVGPTLGFVLGAVCSRIYVNPLDPPSFNNTDPRWIGAWWLGHLIVSAGLFIFSLLMFMFPRNLNSTKTSESPSSLPILEDSPQQIISSEDQINTINKNNCNVSTPYRVENGISSNTKISSNHWKPNLSLSAEQKCSQNGGTEIFGEETGGNSSKESLYEIFWNSEFVLSVGRLFKNKLLVLRTVSSVLHILPIAGLYTFLPKYLETQFRLPVYYASIYTGVGGILVMGLGIFLSGIYIRRRSPSPRSVAGWSAITALLYSIGMVILMFLGCSSDINGLVKSPKNDLIARPPCERTCGSCDDNIFAPVCFKGETYFSACHLGCSQVNVSKYIDVLQFSHCDCLPDDSTVHMNYCDIECPNLKWYILTFALFVIIHSSAEVGRMILTLRCVEPKDKAMALGLISVAIGVFGNVPCPIIYGTVVDVACIHWQGGRNSIGKGACQLYDTKLFRLFFHGTTGGVMFLAFIVDLLVWYQAKYLSFESSLESTQDNVSLHLNNKLDDQETIKHDEYLLYKSEPMIEYSKSHSNNFNENRTTNPMDEQDIHHKNHVKREDYKESSRKMDNFSISQPLLLKCSTSLPSPSKPVSLVLNTTTSHLDSSVPVLIERVS